MGLNAGKKPDISVIVPVYNVEKYIERCLISIREQEFSNFEIICVDDRSPDESISIVEKIARSDKRIRIIRHDANLGLGGARNTGIRAAQGEYIASVDSDDFAEQTMLKALWEGAEGGYFDVVVCGFRSIDEGGKQLSTHMRRIEKIDPVPEDQNPFRVSNPSFWNKLWRKSLYTENNVYFPNHIYFEDSATTPIIYKFINNINFIGGVHYNYVIREGTITNTVSDKHMLDRWREIDTVKDYFYDKKLYSKHREDFVSRIFSGYHYYAEKVHENQSGNEVVVDRYLRHLLLMREGYLHFDDVVRAMSVSEKMDAFKKHAPLRDIGDDSSRNPRAVPLVHNGRNIAAPPSVQILTIFSHENELEECEDSVRLQTYPSVDHVKFSGLGKLEAHHQLYSHIMENRNSANFFLKIDADMVLSDDQVVSDLVRMFLDDAELDHITFQCDDFLTGAPMWGVHMFSNRVSWKRNANGLFSDPKPDRPGKRRLLRKLPRSLVKHSPNPSDMQAFHFGAHRTLKLVQRGYSVEEKRTDPMREHWKVLLDTWNQYKVNGDRRRLLVLLAANLVIEGRLGDNSYDYADESLVREFDIHSTMDENSILAIVARHWEDETAQRLYFERAIGPNGKEKLAREKAAADGDGVRNSGGRPELPSAASGNAGERFLLKRNVAHLKPLADLALEIEKLEAERDARRRGRAAS